MFDYVVQVCRYVEDEFRLQLCSFTNGKMALSFARDVQCNPEVCSVMIVVSKHED